MKLMFTAVVILLITAVTLSFSQSNKYRWLSKYDSSSAISYNIKPPESFVRVKTEPGTFAHWLQHLPIRKGQTQVYSFKREKISSHNAFAIIDVDIGDKDLMQCADAIIRFRSEYFYSKEQYDSIAFNFTSGHRFKFKDWIDGIRPVIDGNKVKFVSSSEPDSSFESFKEYLNVIFTYAGTHSLSRELKTVSNFDSINIGDALILPGFPGHAVLVCDMAADTVNNKTSVLFTQGFMPAQDVHIVKNLQMPDDAPWFEINSGDTIEILYWKFTEEHIRRF